MTFDEAIVQGLLVDLRGASAAERGELVRAAASRADKSVQTIYRWLKAAGWSSGRRVRRDKGASAVDADALRQVSAQMARSRNKRGQPNLPLTEARRLAGEQAWDAARVSRRQLARQLNRRGLGLRHMRAPEAAISRVSRYPNQVWFVDVSVGIQWYFRDERGKKLDLYDDAGARFYEGKLKNVKALRRVIHRYVVVDHYTGAFLVQYFYTSGERAEDVVSCLWTAMAPKPAEVAHAYPFRGVPGHLVADQGSAFRAGIVCSLLEALDVKYARHMPKNPKASGVVEKAHHTWQTSFEGRLAARMAPDLETLNRWALESCALANIERDHGRHGHTRMGLWSTIRPEQLTEVPDRETFFQLAATTRKEAVLDARLWLRADSRKWLVRGEHVHPRQRVTYRLAPFTEAGIRVWDEFDRELSATELEFNAAGFPVNGLRHEWGDEEARGAAAPRTVAHAVAAEVKTDAEAARIPDLFDDHAERLARYAVMNPQGHAWGATVAASAPEAQEPPMGSLEAREEVARRLGRPLGRDGAWWREAIGDGVTASQLEALWVEFTASTPLTHQAREA